ncbi:MAG: hypothetical protein R2857_03070 [Vampirovibrionales bacterium]
MKKSKAIEAQFTALSAIDNEYRSVFAYTTPYGLLSDNSHMQDELEQAYNNVVHAIQGIDAGMPIPLHQIFRLHRPCTNTQGRCRAFVTHATTRYQARA